jgi:hypothetical protein
MYCQGIPLVLGLFTGHRFMPEVYLTLQFAEVCMLFGFA